MRFDIMVGLVFFVVVMAFAAKLVGRKAQICREKVSARIVDLEEVTVHGDKGEWSIEDRPVYEYRWDGRLYHARGRNRAGKRSLGREKEIWLNPENPEEILESRAGARLLQVFCLLFALVLAGLTGIYLYQNHF